MKHNTTFTYKLTPEHYGVLHLVSLSPYINDKLVQANWQYLIDNGFMDYRAKFYDPETPPDYSYWLMDKGLSALSTKDDLLQIIPEEYRVEGERLIKVIILDPLSGNDKSMSVFLNELIEMQESDDPFIKRILKLWEFYGINIRESEGYRKWKEDQEFAEWLSDNK